MNKGRPFVRFVNFLKSVDYSSTTEKIHPDAIGILCKLDEESRNRKDVTVTGLVQCQLYGSLPSVIRRIKELEQHGYIKITRGADKRKWLITLSIKGCSLLRWLSIKMFSTS